MGHTIQGSFIFGLSVPSERAITERISGRLPYTIGKSINDYAAQIDTDFSLGTVEIPYTEGLFIDYRHFDAVR